MKDDLRDVPKQIKSNKVSMKTRKDFTEEVKREALERFDGICAECLNAVPDDFHHIRKRSDGGKGVVTNCLPVCRPCHDEIEQDPSLQMKWREWAKEQYGVLYWADHIDKEEIAWQKIAKREGYDE